MVIQGKFKVRVYGPFGPNQTSETIEMKFKTEELRQLYLDLPKTLEVVVKVWDEE